MGQNILQEDLTSSSGMELDLIPREKEKTTKRYRNLCNFFIFIFLGWGGVQNFI